MKKSTLTILIIEDNPDDQFLYQTYIKKDREYEYAFIEAATGEEGIQRYNADSIDCVILDYNLPDLDGLEFIDSLTATAEGLTIPIILLTGQGNETIAAESMKKGASDYLVKDKVNSEILTRSIKYSIGKSLHEKNRREQLLFLETLIDTIPSPVFYKDRASVFRGCNKAFAELMGKTKDEIIGTCDYEIVPEDFIKKSKKVDEKLLQSPGVETFEDILRLPNGKKLYVIVNKASYTNIFGEVEGLVGVIVDITERKKAEEKVKHLALYDDLTNLPNRRLFFERLSQALSRAKRKHNSVAVMYIDLNGFKEINDNHGHEAGDFVLHELASRIDEQLREMDTAARLGGDEFGVILPEVETSEGIDTVANKLSKAISERLPYREHTFALDSAIGISVYPDDGDEMDELVNRADEAMYMAKSSSKNDRHRNIMHYDHIEQEGR
jgi:diguanylate cyclase (GGDEF)-like protein/PAS domain S-box-containing protein